VAGACSPMSVGHRTLFGAPAGYASGFVVNGAESTGCSAASLAACNQLLATATGTTASRCGRTTLGACNLIADYYQYVSVEALAPPPPAPTRVVSFRATLAGDVASFGTAARARYKQGLASTLYSVSASDIELIVESASIAVTAEIRTTDATVASTLQTQLASVSASQLQTATGFTVTAVFEPQVRIESAPSPEDDNMPLILAAVGGGVAVLLASLALVITCRSSRGKEPRGNFISHRGHPFPNNVTATSATSAPPVASHEIPMQEYNVTKGEHNVENMSQPVVAVPVPSYAAQAQPVPVPSYAAQAQPSFVAQSQLSDNRLLEALTSATPAPLHAPTTVVQERKFDPETGQPLPKFDPNTGVQNWGWSA